MAAIDKIDSLGKPEATKTPTFDNSLVTVIFVLGGPGAGNSILHYYKTLLDGNYTRERNAVRSSCR